MSVSKWIKKVVVVPATSPPTNSIPSIPVVIKTPVTPVAPVVKTPLNFQEDHGVSTTSIPQLAEFAKAIQILPEYLAAIDVKGLMIRLIEVIATNGTKLDAFRVLIEQAVVINTAAISKQSDRLDNLEAVILNMGRIDPEPTITCGSTIPGNVNAFMPEGTDTVPEKPTKKGKKDKEE